MSLDPTLATSTATELIASLRKKSFSAQELTAASIARIEALDPKINAVVVRDFERARTEARMADEALARGDTRPLLGVPMTVKESYDLRGHPTTWGFEEHREHRAREDALAVQRLKAAGAVVLGKTNVPPALADWQSVNPIYGRTNNPYDLTRSPGGSSGGAAAAIAMGFSALEMGSDIGGSIRIPAAFCGVFGHKSTYGIIPFGGHAYGGVHGAPPLLSVLGPLARGADDLALALNVVAGPDGDAPANKLVLPLPRHERLASFRVFILDHHPAAGVDASIRTLLADVARHLAAEGASVSHASSSFPDLSASWRTYQAMLHTITTRRVSNGRPPITSHDWLGHLDDQHRLRRQWADFFRHFDIVLAPAFGTTAFPHTDEPDWRKRELMIDGESTPYGAQLAWASMATVGNLPSTAIPMGLDASGLPLSLQAIGPHLEDLTTIAFAGMIARETPPPRLAL
jgi:amidase